MQSIILSILPSLTGATSSSRITPNHHYTYHRCGYHRRTIIIKTNTQPSLHVPSTWLPPAHHHHQDQHPTITARTIDVATTGALSSSRPTPNQHCTYHRRYHHHHHHYHPIIKFTLPFLFFTRRSSTLWITNNSTPLRLMCGFGRFAH
jgi:hypothetical protein